MKLYFKISIILLTLLLFSISTVNANQIGNYDWNYVEIFKWEEIDVVKNRDLQVSILLELNVKKDILNYTNNFTIYFNQFEKEWNKPITNLNVFACNDTASVGTVYRPEDIDLNCLHNLKVEIYPKPLPTPKEFWEYQFRFFLSDADFSHYNGMRFYFKLNYTIPNYLMGGSKGEAEIKTGCYGTCSASTSITKHIAFPHNYYFNYLPPDSLLEQKYGKQRIMISKFSTAEGSDDIYDIKTVGYTNGKIENRNNILIGVGIGIFTNLIVYALIWLLFTRMDKRKLNDKLDGINNKLDKYNNNIKRIVVDSKNKEEIINPTKLEVYDLDKEIIKKD